MATEQLEQQILAGMCSPSNGKSVTKHLPRVLGKNNPSLDVLGTEPEMPGINPDPQIVRVQLRLNSVCFDFFGRGERKKEMNFNGYLGIKWLLRNCEWLRNCKWLREHFPAGKSQGKGPTCQEQSGHCVAKLLQEQH